MSRPRPAPSDQAVASGDDTADTAAPIFGPPSNSVTLNCLLLSTEAVFAGALELADADQELADSLLNLVSAAENDVPLDVSSVLPTDDGIRQNSLGLEPELTDLPFHTDGLSDWHILTTDETVIAVDYNPGFVEHVPGLVAGDQSLLILSEDSFFSPTLGSQFSPADELIFLDFASFARRSDRGGRGGKHGGKDKNDRSGSDEDVSAGGDEDVPTGSDEDVSATPIVISEYTSGQLDGAESPYNIQIEFNGSWTSTLQTAFIDASEWISSVIQSDVADVFYNGVIDDLRIAADLIEIDGVSGVLGQAGPTAVRTANYLPAAGIMEFDVADAQNYQDLGYWNDIVLHEMLHTVGFGSIWEFKGLIDYSVPGNPTFTGETAVLAYEDLFGGTGDVPLEYGYGPGTDGTHWDEAYFDNELMTGFLDTNGDANIQGMTTNYVSGMTVASLADIGYSVDFTSYDQQVEAIV